MQHMDLQHDFIRRLLYPCQLVIGLSRDRGDGGPMSDNGDEGSIFRLGDMYVEVEEVPWATKTPTISSG